MCILPPIVVTFVVVLDDVDGLRRKKKKINKER